MPTLLPFLAVLLAGIGLAIIVTVAIAMQVATALVLDHAGGLGLKTDKLRYGRRPLYRSEPPSPAGRGGRRLASVS